MGTARVDEPTLLWYFGSDDRRREWRRERVVRTTDDGLEIAAADGRPSATTLSWLAQSEPLARSHVAGEPLDVLVMAALARRDLEEARRLLRLWRGVDVTVRAGRRASSSPLRASEW